eukprot:3015760-Rhodomonas_salina.3
MAAFTIGYQNGYSDSKKTNAPGGQGYSSAYKAGLESGLKLEKACEGFRMTAGVFFSPQHEEHHLQFLQSMRRAREAYYAATSGGSQTSVRNFPRSPSRKH